MSDVVIYEDGSVELNATVENESVWLTQKQLCELFGRDKSVISRHISNIFKSAELEKNSVVAKNATTALDGKTYHVNDGNKRIGAYLFVLFLHKNGNLHKPNGEAKINDNALASLALLVATSAPEQKDIIIKLVMNMLYEGDI